MSSRPVALVTGASRGIGRGIALALAGAGYDLVVNYASNAAAAEDTRQAAQRLGATVECVQADIGVGEDRTRLVEETRRAFGALHLLVNNAGVAPRERNDLLDATEESFDRLVRINLKGPYFLTQSVARWMVEQRKNDAAGRYAIVTISSVSAYTSSTNRGEYCVSKAGLGMMTRLFADRLAEFGVNVYEVRPGIIATDMTAKVQEKYDRLIAEGLLPIRRWGTPEDIGKAVAALAGGGFPYTTGQTIDVDGGFHLHRL